MTRTKKIGIAAASLAAAAVAGFGVVAASTSALAETPTVTPTATATKGADGGGMRGGQAHTPVTGDEAQKVIDAVKAKDSAATITTVEKDADGTYDAIGTKDNAPIRFDVSADLKTVTESVGRGGKGGGMGGHADTVVTGDEAQKVIDAVKAKDSAATITTVQKDEDGSYDAVGTKDGAPIRFDVTADLKTITEHAGGPGGKGDMGGHAHTVVTGDEAQKVIDAVKAKDSAATITTVQKDEDGSYDAIGTKDGAPVRFDVSSDLKTITEGGGKR